MSETLTMSDFQFVRDLVRKKSAIVIEDNKTYLVEARLTLLIKQLKIATVAELINKVRLFPDGTLAHSVIDAMTTNETSFFRDLHPFEALRNHIIPTLVQKRQQEKTLKIWCGAASSGQEPFTIAMLLREYFPELIRDWKITILATDISEHVLERARSGSYSQLEVNRGLPINMLVKYFQKAGVEWQLKEEIHKMVEFRSLNLIGPWPIFPKMDIIFLRNVLIYFDIEVKKKFWQDYINKLPKMVTFFWARVKRLSTCQSHSNAYNYPAAFVTAL